MPRRHARIHPLLTLHHVNPAVQIDACLASGAFDLTRIVKLPYLTAVVKEGLRLSYGICVRLPRITDVPLTLHPSPNSLSDDKAKTKSWIVRPARPSA